MSPPCEDPDGDRWGAWDRFVEAAPEAGFMQSSWWAGFRARYGFDHFGVVLKSHDEIVGGAMVQRFSFDEEHCFYYVQEGPVLPGDDAVAGEVLEAVLDAVDERRASDSQTVSHLRIETRRLHLPRVAPAYPLRAAAPDRFMEPRRTICVDLRCPESEILARMRPKGRYNVRVAQRHGVAVIEDASPRGVDAFLAIYFDTASRQCFDSKPPDYFRALIPLLAAQGKGSLFFAEHEGARIAAAVVVTFGKRATYFFGGSLAQRRHVMAPYLLHFEIMRAARAKGCDWYDLWGVAPEDQPAHPWRDISVLKRKFGGLEIEFPSTLDLVYDRDAYHHYALQQNHREAEIVGGR